MAFPPPLPPPSVYQDDSAIFLHSNKKEAEFWEKFPVMLPWTLEVADGSLLVHKAAYTIEHLVKDISVVIEHPGGDNRYEHLFAVVRGIIEWAAWLIKFGSEHGLHLDDTSPRNAGYEPQEAK